MGLIRGDSADANGAVVGVNSWPGDPARPGSGGNGAWFESVAGEGVRGYSRNPNHGGVVGVNDNGGTAVFATATGANAAIVGINNGDPAVPGSGGPGGNAGWFESAAGEGIRGYSKNPNHGGVVGVNLVGGTAVFGTATGLNAAVAGVNTLGPGLTGNSSAPNGNAIEAVHSGGAATGNALYCRHQGGGTAGFFDGDVTVTGNLQVHGDVLLPARAADCAEYFDICAGQEICPGSVMIVENDSAVSLCAQAYDTRVVGVVSGAGHLRPGLLLNGHPRLQPMAPIALTGKVFCNVDAGYSPIRVGDLLTTSSTPGHAMKAADAQRAFGAVIGKALQPLATGCSQIAVLIGLR